MPPCTTQERARELWNRSRIKRTGIYEEGKTMTQLRGIVLMMAGGFALYRGWRIHTGQYALWAYGLGALAIAVGIWRLIRKEPERLA